MMKKFLIYIIVPILLSSCMKELGSYDYKEVNEIKIDSVKTIYNALQYATLNIVPQISQTRENNESNLSFLWLCTVNTEVDTLSKERNLNKEIIYAPGTYSCTYYVIDNNTGIFSLAKFQMNLQSSLGEGLLVLSNKDGNAKLSYIHGNGTIIQYPDYLGKSGVGVNYHPKSSYSPDYVSVMCNDANGGVILDPASLTKRFDFSNFFYIPPKTINPQSYARSQDYYKSLPNYGSIYNSTLYSEYICNDNKIHMRYAHGAGLKMDAAMVPSDDKGYFASPHILGSNYGPTCMIFDEKNSRFLETKNTNSIKLSPITIRTTTIRKPFDPDNLGANMKMIFSDFGPSLSGNAKIYMIFDSLGQKQFLEAIHYYGNFTPAKRFKLDFPITSKTKFGVSYVTPCFYYSDNNKIHNFDVEVRSSLLRYSLPENEEITCMKSEYYSPKNDKNQYYFDHLRLYVGTKGPAVNGNVGSVYILRINADNTLTLISSYKNIAAEIVSFAWKK